MQKGFRKYEVSPESLAQARNLGVPGDVEVEVARMARRSAPFTRPGIDANRRYEKFVFLVKDDVVRTVMKYDAGTGRVVTASPAQEPQS